MIRASLPGFPRLVSYRAPTRQRRGSSFCGFSRAPTRPWSVRRFSGVVPRVDIGAVAFGVRASNSELRYDNAFVWDGRIPLLVSGGWPGGGCTDLPPVSKGAGRVSMTIGAIYLVRYRLMCLIDRARR